MTQQDLPSVREAEQALLMSLIVLPWFIDDVRHRVTPAMFLDANAYDDRHRRIYKAMLETKPEPLTLIGLVHTMHEQRTYRQGDREYLHELKKLEYDAIDCLAFADIVADYAKHRGVQAPSHYKGLAV